jgi:hypothetical protein
MAETAMLMTATGQKRVPAAVRADHSSRRRRVIVSRWCFGDLAIIHARLGSATLAMSGPRESVRTMFPAADATSTVNTISAVVAAVAALGAVWFARSTVLEAITARRESRNAHREEMNELRAEREAAAERHRAEMLERDATFVAELALRRVAQLEVISGLLLHLVEVAREEYFHPPAPVDVTEQGFGQMVTTTRMPAIRLRLDAAVAAFSKMGGASGDLK